MSKISKIAEMYSDGKKLSEMIPFELHNAVSKALMYKIIPHMEESKQKHNDTRRAYYFSAEYLVGRAIYNNLMKLGMLEEVEKELNQKGASLKSLEIIEDAALGNGGLGRLAACFLDSAATLQLPLDGYGIRYKYGMFKQRIEDGFQKESPDNWARFGDPWSVRHEGEAVNIHFSDMTVRAIPYDMPVLGYGTKNVSILRLWQAEPLVEFDFAEFDAQNYDKAVREKNRAEDISRVIYPNDSTLQGKLLRLRQQYFFTSASLRDIVRNYKKNNDDLTKLAESVTIQLNDTHPVIAIPELIKILTDAEIPFNKAVDIAKEVFNYTNHTVMPEALEKWDIKLIRKISPDIAKIITKLDVKCRNECDIRIIRDGIVNMAYLACYCSKYINGVAEIHTEIIKKSVLREWYDFAPQKFKNETNGITQRRWLMLCNRELSDLITELMGSRSWTKKLYRLRELEQFSDNDEVLSRFREIKRLKKHQLAEYLEAKDNIVINPDTIIDSQIKRLHEYKRQLLNILTILELYYEIKDGEIRDFKPTTFIFGAKAASGYFRAKAIIKLINEVARLIDEDEEVSKFIKVVFVPNYNVTTAEKIIAASDVSVQISTAGTEASGTGNMKLMLNGAVTLGTYDGANIEIVKEAGEENNFIFGARVEDIENVRSVYNPRYFYETKPKIRRVLDALINGTLDDGKSGMFEDLYKSLLEEDRYFVLMDFEDFLNKRKELNENQKNEADFTRKCWLNMCASGKFSSDRTIANYARDIWKIK